ncbi:MAG: hypothetical protein ACLS63_09385 [Flavonifractor plautii]
MGGKLELIPEQAPIIRYIYDAYLAGKTAEDIAATLNLFSMTALEATADRLHPHQ